MDATAKQARLLRQEIVKLCGERDERDEAISELVHTIGGLVTFIVECHDTMVQKDKDIASLTHLLSIYTNADSPSGKDPKGYEAAKAFLATARAYEEAAEKAREAGEEIKNDVEETVEEECEEPPKEHPKEVQPKPCGGQPRHRGVSHSIKSSRTIEYTAEICDECGRTDLDLLPPINKLSVNLGKINWEEEEKKEPKKEDKKDAYTARVTFGWCDPCRRLIDPAPHLVWGTWLSGRSLATAVHFRSNPQGRATIIDNLGTIHKFWISAGAVSNAITAYAKSLEARVLPPSAVAWVKAKMEAKKDSVDGCNTPPVPEATVPEATVQEATVQEATVQEATVQEATVQEATVQEATVQEATVQEATVQEATVQEATVQEATVQEATVQEATVQEATVQEATVQEATVQEATVQEATVQEATVQEATVQEATVQEATVQEATVQEATVQEATVQEATVQEATVQEATVQEATVQEATVQEATVQEATVQEATVQEATVQEATVQEATVQEATVQEATVQEATVQEATVQEATVQEATVQEATVQEATVQEATVQEATVQEATVQEATVQEATVQEATVQEATVQEATVQEATVQEATVQEATVQEATVQEATVQEATVQEATVQEATVQEATVQEATVQEATVQEATVQEATVQEATVQEATVQEATVQEATVQEATVQEATVQEATVQEATVQEATVQEATVQEATVQEATVQEATVQEATVQEATVPDGPEDNPPDRVDVQETVSSPAHPTLPPKTNRRMTKKEQNAEKNRVQHTQTPQGITDAYLTRNTTSYPGSHFLSFLEQCREWLTMAPHMGIDETKTVVAGKWCHAILATSPNVVMIVVRPRKNTKTINWLFGGMQHVCVIHDRIAIYNGFVGMHQECWAHLIRRFMKLAMKYGLGSPEYDRYVVIKALYKRAKNLAERIAAHLGMPSNAAEMAACQHRLEGVWHLFEPEYRSIMEGLQGLVKDLDGQEPGQYLENMLRRALTFVKRPGTPGTNNDTEGGIRWHVIRPRHIFGSLPNWRAARNYGVIQSFAATCRKNGVSPYHAVLARGRDPDWDVFTSRAHPPIFPHMA